MRLGPPGARPRGPNGRGINPWIAELKGCHHCGGPHPRGECDAYKDLLAKNGGQRPPYPQYKGALDKLLEEKGKAFYGPGGSRPQSVASMSSKHNAAEEPEHTEGNNSSSDDEDLAHIEFRKPCWKILAPKKTQKLRAKRIFSTHTAEDVEELARYTTAVKKSLI